MQMSPIPVLSSRRTVVRFVLPSAPPARLVETEEPPKAAVNCWRQTPGCFRPPAARPTEAAEPTESLRDQARRTLADRLHDDFKARLNVVGARAGASSAERQAALQKSMATAYLLGLPVSPGVARGLDRVEEWTPQQVFGRTGGELAALLKRLRVEALTELEVNRMPAGDVHDEVVQAASDFWEYVDECIDNIGEMRRADGSYRRRLSSATMEQIRRTAFHCNRDGS